MNHQQKYQVSELMDWVTSRLRLNDVPRVSDVVSYAKSQNFTLSKNVIAKALRTHVAYEFNMPQQRQIYRSQKFRPIIVNSLGHLHADIGKFAIVRDYETPVTFRAGYLIAKDVLSRYVYIVLLRKTKSADALLKAFQEILEIHAKTHPSYAIKSISFDKEPGVMSDKVQSFFQEKNIKFHPFQMTASKAKMAEGAIKQVRVIISRLMKMGRPKDRWWNLLPEAVKILNSQKITIDGKRLDFAPKDINLENVTKFKKQLEKAAPAYFFAQYEISPKFVTFKYSVGTFVRVKAIITSSAVLGQKRSEKNVSDDVYQIEKRNPFVARGHKIGKTYACRHVKTGEIEHFEENDLVEIDQMRLFNFEKV